MLDHIKICVGIGVLGYALQAIEQASRIDADESIDAHVADVGRVTRDPVGDVAMLFDLLPARAVVEVLRDLHAHKIPLCSRHLEAAGMGERQYVCFEPFDVVIHGFPMRL